MQKFLDMVFHPLTALLALAVGAVIIVTLDADNDSFRILLWFLPAIIIFIVAIFRDMKHKKV